MMTPGARREPNGRILAVAGAIIALLAIMALRVAQLTIIEGGQLSEIAWQQYRRTLRMAGSRGSILDRNHEVLADTVSAPSIYAGPRYHPVSADDAVKLALALEMPVASLERRLAPSAGFVWLKRRATREQARAVERLGIPGVGISREGRRLYPQGALAAHVIGTAGSDLRGLEGVELRYDRWMRGEDTVLSVERDGRGRSLLMQGVATAPNAEPAPAIRPPRATLELTIDAGIQSMVERELAAGVEAAGADAGTAIVLDPWSGAVLALANVPTYDPNHPGQANPAQRRNRAVTDVFEPGSTFKAFSVAAALQEGAVSTADRIDCENGSYRIGGWTIHDHHRYGLLTVPEVIQYSSNIGASKIVQRIGSKRFSGYLERFGFGRLTAIDLPGEVPGLLHRGDRWALIDLATSSFGQGIAVTPIQLAAAFGAIGNGGRLYQPYVLARATDSEGRTLFDWDPSEGGAGSRQVIDENTARKVAEMLERVVSEKRGTGTKAQIPGVRVAGKTGTAQKVDHKTGRYSRERLASFIGFAPADNPAVVTLVMIDNPRRATYGGIVAAPVFSEITSRALDQLGRRPQLEAPLPRLPVNPSPVVAVAAPLDGLPSFLGLSFRRALDSAREQGIEVEVRGSGFVVAQEPPAGAPRDGGKVLLILEPFA